MRGTIKHTKIKSINVQLFCVFASIIACLFICFSALCLSANKAFASPTVAKIDLSQQLTSKQGQEMQQTFSYTFEAVSDDAPMPSGAQSGKYIFEITGSNEYSFDITLSKASGAVPFKYKLYMNVPEAQQYYTYDSSVYDIEIYSTLVEDPIVIYKNAAGDKLPNPPTFEIVYDEPGPGPGPDPDPDPTPTPDPTRPPQTVDAATIFMIFVGFIALFAVGLFMYSQGKKKNYK